MSCESGSLFYKISTIVPKDQARKIHVLAPNPKKGRHYPKGKPDVLIREITGRKSIEKYTGLDKVPSNNALLLIRFQQEVYMPSFFKRMSESLNRSEEHTSELQSHVNLVC